MARKEQRSRAAHRKQESKVISRKRERLVARACKEEEGARPFKVVKKVPTELEPGTWTIVRKAAEGYHLADIAMQMLDKLEYPAYVVKEMDEESGEFFYTASVPDIDDLLATRPDVPSVQKALSYYLHCEIAERMFMRLLPPRPSVVLHTAGEEAVFDWKICLSGRRLLKILADGKDVGLPHVPRLTV